MKSIIFSFENFRFYEMCKIIVIYNVVYPTIDIYEEVCSGYKNVELYKKSFPLTYDDYLIYLSHLISPEDILIFSDDMTLFHPDKINLVVSLLSSNIILRHDIYVLPSSIETFEDFLENEDDIIPNIKKEGLPNTFTPFSFYGMDLLKMIHTRKIPSHKKIIDVEGYKLSYTYHLI